jgi:hypothetical protein
MFGVGAAELGHDRGLFRKQIAPGAGIADAGANGRDRLNLPVRGAKGSFLLTN